MLKTFYNEIYAGINTVNGYINLLENELLEARTVYILKGSPGSGKSTLLKSLCDTARERGEPMTVVRCSADPSSYDAVIFHNIKAAVADGTAPHVLEPKLAGARERIINLGDCWDTAAIVANHGEIAQLTASKSRFYANAYRLLKAYGEVEAVYDSYSEGFVDNKKLAAYALRFFEKYIKTFGGKGVSIRQSDVFGAVGFDRTPCVDAALCVLVRDKFNVGARLFNELLKLTKCAGVTAQLSLSPLDANKIIAMYFPDDDIYIRSDKFIPFEGDKTVSADRFLNKEFFRAHKEKLAFLRRLQKEIICEASQMFQKSFDEHAKIEKIYIKATDFSVINSITNALKNKLFGSY